jgi:hypothetical protein
VRGQRWKLVGFVVLWVLPIAVLAGVTTGRLAGAPADPPTSAAADDPGALSRYGDFFHFWWAGRAFRVGASPYEAAGEYLYPPLLATALSPLADGSMRAGAATWTWLSAGAMVFAFGVIAWAVSKRLGVRRDAAFVPAVAGLTVLACVELIRSELRWVQTDGVVLAALAVALATVGRGGWRGGVCGAAIGVAINVKFQALVLLPWLAWRRRWVEFWSALIVGAALLLVGVPGHGWEAGLSYAVRGFGELGGVAGIAGGSAAHPVEWHGSVSALSGAVRVFGDVGWLIALGVGAGTGLLVVLMGRSLGGRWSGRVDGDAGRLLVVEFCVLLLGMLAVSPQSMSRHFLLIAPAVAVAWAVVLGGTQVAARVVAGFGLVVLVGGVYLPPGGVEVFAAAVDVWQRVGGMGWCALAGAVLVMGAVGLEGRRDVGSP